MNTISWAEENLSCGYLHRPLKMASLYSVLSDCSFRRHAHAFRFRKKLVNSVVPEHDKNVLTS
jgi:hypothetical protein